MGSIKVVKTSVGGYGEFDFTSTNPTLNTALRASIFTTSSNDTNFRVIDDLPVNATYSISEVVPTGWSLGNPVICRNDITGATSPVTAIAVGPGQHTTCTFINTLQGTLRIVKETTGGNDTFNFAVDNLTPSPLNIPTSQINGDQGYGEAEMTLPPSYYGYAVVENSPTNWRFDDASCVLEDGQTPTGIVTGEGLVQVRIIAGETTTCTFINTFNAPGSIRVLKTTIGGAGSFNFTGSPGISPFPLNVAGTPIPKGSVWTSRTPAANHQWRDITYGNGTFVAISMQSANCDGGAGSCIMISPDGITWTKRSQPNTVLSGIAFGNNTFVAVGRGNVVKTSHDNGETW